MADDKSTPNRQVHFDNNPVSNIVLFQERPPHFSLRVSPPTPQASSSAEDFAAFAAFSPTRGRGERRTCRARDPSPYPLRDHRNSGAEDLSSDDDDKYIASGYDVSALEETWSPERELDETEDNKASQTKSAIQHFLYVYGDVRDSLDTTRRVLDELATDFITELCFEASRSAQLAGRQKIKIDDIRFACRKSPVYLGKIQDIQEKKEAIDNARKTLDVNDDKITKSSVKTMEEPPLGDADDDPDMDTHVSRAKGASGR